MLNRLSYKFEPGLLVEHGAFLDWRRSRADVNFERLTNQQWYCSLCILNGSVIVGFSDADTRVVRTLANHGAKTSRGIRCIVRGLNFEIERG